MKMGIPVGPSSRHDIVKVVVTYDNGDVDEINDADIEENGMTTYTNHSRREKGEEQVEWDNMVIHLSGPKRPITFVD